MSGARSIFTLNLSAYATPLTPLPVVQKTINHYLFWHRDIGLELLPYPEYRKNVYVADFRPDGAIIDRLEAAMSFIQHRVPHDINIESTSVTGEAVLAIVVTPKSKGGQSGNFKLLPV